MLAAFWLPAAAFLITTSWEDCWFCGAAVAPTDYFYASFFRGGEFGWEMLSEPIFLTLRIDFLLLMVKEGAMIFRIRFYMGLSDFDNIVSDGSMVSGSF